MTLLNFYLIISTFWCQSMWQKWPSIVCNISLGPINASFVKHVTISGASSCLKDWLYMNNCTYIVCRDEYVLSVNKNEPWMNWTTVWTWQQILLRRSCPYMCQTVTAVTIRTGGSRCIDCVPQEASDGHLLTDCGRLKLMHCGIQKQYCPHGVHIFDMQQKRDDPRGSRVYLWWELQWLACVSWWISYWSAAPLILIQSCWMMRNKLRHSFLSFFLTFTPQSRCEQKWI